MILLYFIGPLGVVLGWWTCEIQHRQLALRDLQANCHHNWDIHVVFLRGEKFETKICTKCKFQEPVLKEDQ